MNAPSSDVKLEECRLDKEQRRRADALYQHVVDDPEMASFEIIWLRDRITHLEQRVEDLERYA